MTTRHESDHTEVLVVGAGPVGLTAACALRRLGVGVRIVDRDPASTVHSRAVIMWPRSLELMRGLGVAGRLTRAGHPIHDVSYWSGDAELGRIEMSRLTGTPYPYGLCSPQHRTEDVLRERLRELGCEVATDTELTGLDEHPDGVVARLRHDGVEQECWADWVIGADGSHSTVRALAGIEFRGTGRDVLFAIADGPLDGDLPAASMLYCYSGGGAMGLAPFGDGTFRVACSVPVWDDDVAPPRELFQDNLDRIVPFRAELGELSWTTVFRARRRTAATFRSGRTFLAGDAAHIFSAAGSQGMNTGIQDAVNLAWRLGSVLAGTAGPEVLDGYDRERRHSAERVSQVTAVQTRWGLYDTPVRTAVRDVLVRGAQRTGVLQKWVTPLMSQLTVDYRSDSADPRADIRWRERPVRAGERLPVFGASATAAGDPPSGAPGAAADGWPTVAPDRFTVLVWPGRSGAGHELVVARLRAGLPGAVDVLDGAGHPELARYLPRGAAALVVRPDGHLAVTADDTGPDAVRAAIAACGATTGAPVDAHERVTSA